MDHLEIWETITDAVREALDDGLYLLDERELGERADALLRDMPVVGGSQPTAALLLRRYRSPLQKELCSGHRPRPLPGDLLGEVCELTRAVMVAVAAGEGLSVDVAVLLALAIRAGGLSRFCEVPATATV